MPKRALWLGLLLALLALAFCASAAADNYVALGSDYFQTVPGMGMNGTYFDFGGNIGVVDFRGLPVGPGNTDTIIQRQANADLTNPAAIPIQITTLSMESTLPVNVNGNLFNVFVNLDPANYARDTGTMTITGNTTTGGTFSSMLNVYFAAQFIPLNQGNAFTVYNNINLTSSGSPWAPLPSPLDLLIYSNDPQAANCHAAGPMCLGAGGQYSDFFLPQGVDSCGTGECHQIINSMPEPSTFLLLGPAGMGLFWKLRTRRSGRA